MTTISSWGTGALAAQRADSTFKSLKSSMGDAQLALTTGKTAATYAGIGAATKASLSARTTLANLASYGSNVADGLLRVKLASTGVQQIQKLGTSLTNLLPSSYSSTSIGQTTAMVSAEDGLKQIIETLNTDVNGRYLYSGRTPDVKPVASYDLILNGDATRAGLTQLVGERKAADLGTAGLGRLGIATSTTDVTLSEEAAGLPFGMKILSATATGAGVTAATSAGPPSSATLSVAAQPEAGDTVAIKLGLPDGTSTTLTLTASATAGAAGTFAIGATPDDTAANLAGALQASLATTATTTLASASTTKASADFFAGSASNPPVRVAGPPYASATATVAGTSADTVIWYGGDDGGGSPRETSPVRTGDASSVAIGLRANEQPFRTIVAALGSLVAESFPTTDPTSQARYAALATRVSTAGGNSGVATISADLANANAALGASSDRIKLAKSHAEDIVSGIEDADPNQVATELLETQTRLQASYQTTATIAKMSLTNYL